MIADRLHDIVDEDTGLLGGTTRQDFGDARAGGAVDAVDAERAVRGVALLAQVVGHGECGRDRHRVRDTGVGDGRQDDAGHVRHL